VDPPGRRPAFRSISRIRCRGGSSSGAKPEPGGESCFAESVTAGLLACQGLAGVPYTRQTILLHLTDNRSRRTRQPSCGGRKRTFEVEGLRLKPLEPLVDSEEPRSGEGDRPCRCTDPEQARAGAVWEDDHWMLTVADPSGAPVVLLLVTKEHYDFTTLPEDLAAEMGRIMVGLSAAIEALPSVARAHVSRWGDGRAHLHVFFIARPARMPQLRGTCMALWDDFLPPVLLAVRDENVRFVIQRLVASYGGHGVGPAAGE